MSDSKESKVDCTTLMVSGDAARDFLYALLNSHVTNCDDASTVSITIDSDTIVTNQYPTVESKREAFKNFQKRHAEENSRLSTEDRLKRLEHRVFVMWSALMEFPIRNDEDHYDPDFGLHSPVDCDKEKEGETKKFIDLLYEMEFDDQKKEAEEAKKIFDLSSDDDE